MSQGPHVLIPLQVWSVITRTFWGRHAMYKISIQTIGPHIFLFKLILPVVCGLKIKFIFIIWCFWNNWMSARLNAVTDSVCEKIFVCYIDYICTEYPTQNQDICQMFYPDGHLELHQCLQHVHNVDLCQPQDWWSHRLYHKSVFAAGKSRFHWIVVSNSCRFQ